MTSAEEDTLGYTPNVTRSLFLGRPCRPSQHPCLLPGPALPAPPSYPPQEDVRMADYYPPPPGVRPGGAPALESPRIEITAYGQFPEEELEESSLPAAQRLNSVVTLTLPGSEGYRNPGCLSPASSLSSRSGHSEASSYESGFSYNCDNSPQNSPWQSPCVSPQGCPSLALPGDTSTHAGTSLCLSPSTSPHASGAEDSLVGGPWGGSRSSSPCGGKRKYSFNGAGSNRSYPYSPEPSPRPSPHTSPRLSITEESWLPNTNQYTNSAIVAAINALTTDGLVELGEGVPVKARRTTLEPGSSVSLKVEPGGENQGPEALCGGDYPTACLPFKKEGYCGGFLDVPQHPFSWSKPNKYVGPSLPALDWQLPSSSGSYNLQIDVQPRSHHRAHYETEGSRGAVKALGGGHPVVQLNGYMESEPQTLQLFIGTADDRFLRPHAFYQVHRITGKTVSTPSQEALQASTKLLEIPLLPENNMRAIIDCAGILKLRNSDIELRKGETDIGRKNTRVRMVFRVHVSQPSGRTASLQVASNPIECSQRSAQELPLVEHQSLGTSGAAGGDRMLVSGQNFQLDSKVVFLEKAQDGHHLWETEAKVDKDSITSTSLLLEVPPYRKHSLSSPVHVNFYVCNGKRKRSQFQRFTYVPANIPTIKMEPQDDYEPSQVSNPRGPGRALHPKSCYAPQVTTPTVTSDLRPCVVDGDYPACERRLGEKPSRSCPSSPSTSPKLHDLSPSPFSKYLSDGPPQRRGPPSPIPQASIVQETSAHHQQPTALHPASSASSSPASTPGAGPEVPFPPALTPARPGSSSSSGAQLLPKVPGRSLSSSGLRTKGSSPTPAVSIKQEPQDLDQMYLDDVNEIIRKDLSSSSVQSEA